jgi:hypothetical protein
MNACTHWDPLLSPAPITRVPLENFKAIKIWRPGRKNDIFAQFIRGFCKDNDSSLRALKTAERWMVQSQSFIAALNRCDEMKHRWRRPKSGVVMNVACLWSISGTMIAVWRPSNDFHFSTFQGFCSSLFQLYFYCTHFLGKKCSSHAWSLIAPIIMKLCALLHCVRWGPYMYTGI